MIWLRYLAMSVAAIVWTGAVAGAQEVPAAYRAVLSALGKTGDFNVTERSNAATEERLKSGHAVGGLSIG
jgi:hypothetical protein